MLDGMGSSDDRHRPEQHRTADVVRRLNRAFYKADPGVYFRMRVNACVSLKESSGLSAEPGALSAAILERAPGFSVVPDSEDGELIDQVLTLEAIGLACHAAESLLRHVFAHFDARTSRTLPWLAMAKLRAGKQFNSRTDELRAMGDLELDTVADHVFLPSVASFRSKVSAAALVEHRRYLREWLRFYGQLVKSHRNGYNALKHGLASVPESVYMYFKRPDGSTNGPAEVPFMVGSAVQTLERRQSKWVNVVRAVDVPGLMITTLNAATMMSWLWAVGKALALGTPVEVPMSTGPLPREILDGHERQWTTLSIPATALPLPPEQARTVLSPPPSD